MQVITNEKNNAVISGKISEAPVFSHELYGEGFYLFFVDVLRTSGMSDRIPVITSERLISPDELIPGKKVKVEGQFRSHNSQNGTKSKLKLMVFARECMVVRDMDEPAEDSEIESADVNTVVLDGFICKTPVYRVTPFKREITDLLLAVNRSFNKSDYIPCICWGRNARFCGKLSVGENVKITGRIQSRVYVKKFPDGTETEMVAYEVSISGLEKMKKTEDDGENSVCN